MEISSSLQETIVSYYEGKLTQSQADELLSWVKQSDENLRCFRQVGEIWYVTGTLSRHEYANKAALNVIKKKISANGLRKLPAREIRLRFSTLIRVAAVAIVLAALGITGIVLFPGKEQPAVISASFVETSAPKGSRAFITLPDGTSVWLNADTRFRYPLNYGTTNRTVYLDGEAYFKVSKNRDIPFRVTTSDITVTALGTAFNVKAYQEEGTIETTLEEGRVRIESIDTESKEGHIKPVILKPKQSAVFQKQEGDMVVTEKEPSDELKELTAKKKLKASPIMVSNVTDTRLYTSWKDSRWIFKNEKLSSLVPKLERRYDVTIEFVDKSLEDYAFNGTLLEESLEQILTAIQLAAPIRFEIYGKKVKLYTDKRLLEYYNRQKQGE